MQSRKASLAEALTNIAVGMGVSLASQIIIFSAHGIQVSLGTNMEMTLWFTLVSLARSFILRRVFNNLTVKRLA